MSPLVRHRSKADGLRQATDSPQGLSVSGLGPNGEYRSAQHEGTAVSLAPAPPPPRPHQPAQPLLGVGRVRHQRLRPAAHGFDYPTWFLMLPMRQLQRSPCPALRRNRRGWVSFHDTDHGDGGPDALAWLDARLAQAGLRADGEVWLHTYPRIFGFTFKPVSFWYCHGADGALVAVLAEVNSTFGERHTYLLSGPQLGWGREQQAGKAMQVSPFCRVEGRYRFRFMRTAGSLPAGPQGAAAEGDAGRTVVRIDYDDAQGPLLQTSVSGRLQPLSPARLRRALWRMPLLTLGVAARIHWQALRLWLKRVPFVGTSGAPPTEHPRTDPR